MLPASVALALVAPAGLQAVPAHDYFEIAVLDEQTGRGVPLVELRTVHGVRCWTDSNGLAAFHEPGLMGRDVFFHVRSHGYELAPDGFGFAGRALRVTEGGRAEIRLRRVNVAERLYRVTGGGIYRDSLLLRRPVPLREPILAGMVLGQDSVVNAVFRGRLYWFWGDTNRPAYPLGNFHVPGATSSLPGAGGLDPSAGVDLEYFVGEDGFAKATCRMPGEGPTWISGPVVLRDESGRERMFAGYVKVRGHLQVHARGLAEWEDERREWRHVCDFPMDAPAYPDGHPFLHSCGGRSYVYFAHPYPLVRVPADPESLADLSRYEAYTCLQEGSRLDEPQIERHPDGPFRGLARYAWRRDAPAVGPGEQAELVRRGILRPEEGLLQLHDVETGEPVLAHSGSVAWNEYRQRWILIALEQWGTSPLGEVWYAEAPAPLGPWIYARKVVTHERYSFYNPKQHPYFAQEGGRFVYFEGTYATTFSGNDDATPRYDYNQIMYRLDLADSRLVLPVPVFRWSDARGSHWGTGAAAEAMNAAPPEELFCAYDRPAPGALPVTDPDGGEVRFWALPREGDAPPAAAAVLGELRGGGEGAGARAWPNPFRNEWPRE